ncbi:unnamed protein product, partial [Effrenium voratum]
VAPASASTNLLTQGKPIGGRPVARTMRDGTQICQAFQHGKCGAKGKCMQGVHRCGVVIRGDRVCGLGHAAKDCTGGKKCTSSCCRLISLQRPLIALLSHGRGRSRGSSTMVALHHNHFARSSTRRAYQGQGLEPSLCRQPGLRMGFGGNRAAGGAGRGIYSREPRPEPTLGSAPAWSNACGSQGDGATRPTLCAGWSSSQVAATAPQPGRDRRLAPMACQHSHDPKEWPVERATGRFYPSKEEAEYTAPLCFALAVAASWRAVRTGRAVLRDWLLLDPRAMREWAMAPVALSVGLRLRGAQAQGLPVRAQAQAVLGERKFLPDAHIYVSMGHHSHRLACSKWAASEIPGLPHYVAHIHQSGLFDQLEELEGMTLVCDCAIEVPCEADVLIGLLF